MAAIGLSYVYEIAISGPDWGAIAYHTVVPELHSGSVLVAVGILGATVMPHNVFLHSSLIQTRLNNNNGVSPRRLRRYALADTVVALVLAGLVNASILIMSAAVFYKNDVQVVSIEQAHATLQPLLGGLSSLVFAVALLCSGLASSTTATLAGQVIMEGFLNIRIRLWLRRLITRLVTLVPAIAAIASGVEPLHLLVVSQVILSLQLPFTVVPLIYFTARPDVMKGMRNRPLMILVSVGVAGVIITLNALVLYQLVGGEF